MEELVTMMPRLKSANFNKKSELRKFNQVSEDKFIGASFYLTTYELPGCQTHKDETKTLYSIPTVRAAINAVGLKLIESRRLIRQNL